jgi:hypothetical protein
MARNLTDKGVAVLKPKTSIYHQRDPQMPGHFIRVRPTGSKQFVAMTRNPFAMNDAGKPKQEWHTIGTYPLIGIEEARAEAREIINRVKTGQRVDGPESFEAVANEWLKRHVEAKGLRSEPAVRRNLRNHVLPAWGGRDFKSIGRTDVTKLCDAVEDHAGPVQADMILATVTSIFKWFASGMTITTRQSFQECGEPRPVSVRASAFSMTMKFESFGVRLQAHSATW